MDTNDPITNTMNPLHTSEDFKVDLKQKIHKRHLSSSGIPLKTKSKFSTNEISPSKTSPIHLSQRGDNLWPEYFKSFTDDEFLFPDYKPKSLITKLNEEIANLSGELKEANKIIDSLMREIKNKNTAYEKKLTAIREDFGNQIMNCTQMAEDEKDRLTKDFSILQLDFQSELKKNQVFFQSQLNQKDQDYEEKIEKLIYSHKKQLISIENYFIEIIMSHNHKFVEEIEFLHANYRKSPRRFKNLEKTTANCSDKDSDDASTLFVPNQDILYSSHRGNTMKTENYMLSPLPFNHLKLIKSEDSDCELDLSMGIFLNKSNDIEGHEVDIKIRSALRIIFNIIRKNEVSGMKKRLLRWEIFTNKNLNKQYLAFFKLMSQVVRPTLKKTLNHSFGAFFYNLFQIFSKNFVKKAFSKWKSQKISPVLQFKEMLNITSLVEFIKKKTFSLQWASWKSLKNTNNSDKIHNKQLIKKYIEQWKTHIFSTEDKYFESFYHWRGLIKLEKVFKLKEYKSLFS